MAAGRITGKKSKLVLVLILGVSLFTFFTLPVRAEIPVIDLQLGEEVVTGWNADNICPGQQGFKTFLLHNAGSHAGDVSIWIGGINETDYAGNGVSLDDYLLFTPVHERLYTNLSFPCTIHEFPQNASDPLFIRIIQLNAGETLSLEWMWEFQMKEIPQNGAQGDSLSFSINYLLETPYEKDTSGENKNKDNDPEPPPVGPPSFPLIPNTNATFDPRSPEPLPPGPDTTKSIFASRTPDNGNNYALPGLLALIALVLILHGIRFLPPFMLSRKALVAGSNSLIEIHGAGSLEPVFSRFKKLAISRKEFEKLDGTEILQSVNELMEKKRIKVIDTGQEFSYDVLVRYGISDEDADVIATAITGRIKNVLLESAESREAAKDMGLKVFSFSDLRERAV
ncbi:MAG: hypothetical protein PHV51_05730 [Methanosarcinaceae archaeon]|nr:hypothetical protein [Methanosarcinaceae archaeon]